MAALQPIERMLIGHDHDEMLQALWPFLEPETREEALGHAAYHGSEDCFKWLLEREPRETVEKLWAGQRVPNVWDLLLICGPDENLAGKCGILNLLLRRPDVCDALAAHEEVITQQLGENPESSDSDSDSGDSSDGW